MVIEKIIEKFKDVLTEEDLKVFQEQLKEFITEESKKISDLIVEEKTKAIQEASDKLIEETKETLKVEIAKDYDAKMEKLEEDLIVKLDTTIDNLIESKISDDLISKVALNETLEPVIVGIKKLFSDNLLDLDLEGSGVVSKLKVENENLSKQLSESMAEKITLSETLEKISVKTLISESVSGLNDVQKDRVIKMFENKKFDDVKTNIDAMIDLVISEENKGATSKSSAEVIVEGDGIIVEKKPLNKNEYSAVEEAKKFFK